MARFADLEKSSASLNILFERQHTLTKSFARWTSPPRVSCIFLRRPFGFWLGDASVAGSEPSLWACSLSEPSLLVSLLTVLSATLVASLPESSSAIFEGFSPFSARSSRPFTQHARQKNLPLSPIWQANSLCIGLSPSKARTMGMRSTG